MNRRTPSTSLTAADAEAFDQLVATKRAAAESRSDTVGAAQLEAEATGLELMAAKLRDPAARGVPVLRKGHGGETTPPDNADYPWRIRCLAQSVQAPLTMLAADASLVRLGLARDADVLPLAVEAAQDAGAQTATEKMLAHQLAAAYRLGMELLGAATGDVHRHRTAQQLNPDALADAARSGAVAARLLAAFAQGALALDRLRNGNRQVVTVQHVTVADGGKAIVAGTVTAGTPQKGTKA